MSDAKTNVDGLVIRRGGEYPDDLPFLLIHEGSGGVLSEHTENSSAHVAAKRFAQLADWSGDVSRPHGYTAAARRANARTINSITAEYTRAKRMGRA